MKNKIFSPWFKSCPWFFGSLRKDLSLFCLSLRKKKTSQVVYYFIKVLPSFAPTKQC